MVLAGRGGDNLVYMKRDKRGDKLSRQLFCRKKVGGAIRGFWENSKGWYSRDPTLKKKKVFGARNRWAAWTR